MWIVVGIPFVSIVVTLSIVWISISTFDGLVVDDYYKKGLEINRSIARDEFARTAGVQGNLAINDKRLELTLQSNIPLVWPDTLNLGFYHPTISGKDVDAILQKVGKTVYVGSFGGLPRGRWYLQVGTEQWRLESAMFYPDYTSVSMLPVAKR